VHLLLDIIEINTHIFLLFSKETTVSGRFWSKGKWIALNSMLASHFAGTCESGRSKYCRWFGWCICMTNKLCLVQLLQKRVSKLYSETEYNVSVGSDGFKHYTEGIVSTCKLALQLLCLWYWKWTLNKGNCELRSINC
jgi:hypothetical protein